MPVANFLTMSEAADELNVTRQRLHQLVKAYGLTVEKVHVRLTMIKRSELKKIPKNRPNGVRTSDSKK